MDTALTITDYINYFVAILSIGLGVLGWLFTSWTMQALDMRSGPTNMAFTEVSGVSGCLFVGIGIGVLVLDHPVAWIALGTAYAGAAVGRVTSILRDSAASRKSWTFFATETALGAWLVLANMGSV